MKNVTIYSTPTCIYCNLAKQFFAENKIKYTEHNVATDFPKRKEMVDLSGQMGVPVIKIGEKIIIGFDEEGIKEELGI